MKQLPIIVISGIHGNYEALKAVIADVCHKDPLNEGYHVFCLGDVVDYGPQSVECITELKNWKEAVRKHGNIWCEIPGNHEDLVLGTCSPDKLSSDRGRKSLELTFEQLSKFPLVIEYLSYLEPAPTYRCINDIDIWAQHAGPKSNWKIPTEEEMDSLNGVIRGYVLFGHSHIPLIYNTGSVIFVNPGSVGQPRDNDPRASYARIDFCHEFSRPSIIRVEYDIEATISKMDSRQHPYYSERLRVGK